MQNQINYRLSAWLTSALVAIAGGTMAYPAWQETSSDKSESSANQDADSEAAKKSGEPKPSSNETKKSTAQSEAKAAKARALNDTKALRIKQLEAQTAQLKALLESKYSQPIPAGKSNDQQLQEYKRLVTEYLTLQTALQQAQQPTGILEYSEINGAMVPTESNFALGFYPSQPNLPERTADAPSTQTPRVYYFEQPATASQPRLATRRAEPNGDPRSRELDNEIRQCSQELKTAESEEEKTELKARIKASLETQYSLYLEQHEAPLKELEARVEKLRAEFEFRKSAKDDLVKLRLDTIWYDSQGLGWPGAGSNSQYGSGFQDNRQQPIWLTPNPGYATTRNNDFNSPNFNFSTSATDARFFNNQTGPYTTEMHPRGSYDNRRRTDPNTSNPVDEQQRPTTNRDRWGNQNTQRPTVEVELDQRAIDEAPKVFDDSDLEFRR